MIGQIVKIFICITALTLNSLGFVYGQEEKYWLTVLPYVDLNETSNLLGYVESIDNETFALMAGTKLTGTGPDRYQKVVKIDAAGNSVWEYYYDNLGVTFQVGGSFTVDEHGNSYFATGDVIDPTSGQKRPQLHMLDSNGNLLWQLEFTGDQFDHLFDTTNGLAPRKDGNGVVYVGQISGNDSWMKLDIDTLGNVLSQLTFEAPVLPGQFIYGYAMKVVSEANGNFLIAYQNSFGAASEHSYLTRFDSTGQVLVSHDARKLSQKILEWGEDKIVWGFYQGWWDFEGDLAGPYLHCYGVTNFDSIWGIRQSAPWLQYNDEIGGILEQGRVNGLTETRSGKLVSLVGRSPWLFALQQFDQDGELEWTRWTYMAKEVWYDIPPDDQARWDALFLEATEDGGFVVGGTHIYRDATSPVWGGCYKATYLMKLDSFGCAVPGCQNDTVHNLSIISDVAEITTTAPQLELTVFPNPTQDRLRVKLTGVGEEATYLAGLRYSVYDHLGRRLANGLYESDGVKVGDLQPGYYYLRVRDEEGKERTVGFLKQ